MSAAPAIAPLLTAAQVAARLHIEASDVLACLPAYRMGRRTLYDATDVANWRQTPTGRALLSILRSKPRGLPWWRCLPTRPRPEPTP